MKLFEAALLAALGLILLFGGPCRAGVYHLSNGHTYVVHCSRSFYTGTNCYSYLDPHGNDAKVIHVPQDDDAPRAGPHWADKCGNSCYDASGESK